MKFKSIDPYTEEVNWTYDSFPIGECKYQIEKSRSAFLSWSSLSDEDTDIGPLAKKEFVNSLEKLLKVCNVEVFGPIAPIITARDENNAVEIANSTEYGLGAKIWYGNPKRAERLAKKIKSGFVAINGIHRSDPRPPFGGINKSGIGRELSHYGLKEFVNIKTILVNK